VLGAQHRASKGASKSAGAASFEGRYRGHLRMTKDWDGPGSAAHHCVLRCALGKASPHASLERFAQDGATRLLSGNDECRGTAPRASAIASMATSTPE